MNDIGTRWKIIEGHPNYEVSKMGEVRNIKTGNLLTPYDDGDLLLDFMNLYGLDNLRDATVHQLKEYIRNNHLEEGEE